jgi:hypothetical protein
MPYPRCLPPLLPQASQTSFSVCANESDPLGYASCQKGAHDRMG